jgi:hypothetical protein
VVLVSRRTNGAALLRGFEAQLRAQMHAEAQQLREAIALDHEALHAELAETRRALEAAKSEVARLLAMVNAMPPSRRLH